MGTVLMFIYLKTSLICGLPTVIILPEKDMESCSTQVKLLKLQISDGAFVCVSKGDKNDQNP